MQNTLRFFPVIVFLASFGLVVVDGSGQVVVREVLKRMDEYSKRITTLKADITMVKVDAALGDDLTISTGTVRYAKQPKKDALMRLDWKKPEESLAVVDGEYRMYRKRLEVAYKGPIKELNKQGSTVNPNAALAFSFVGTSKDDLSARYDVSVLSRNARLKNGIETFHLQLTPKAKMKYKTAELWVDVDGAPVQIRINEYNNDSTTILLTNPEPNISLKKSDFVIEWPKGTVVKRL